MGLGDESGDAGEVDDGAFADLAHLGGGQSPHAGVGDGADVKDAMPVVGGGIETFGVEREGIVDQVVDSFETLDGLLDDAGGEGLLCHVAMEEEDAPSRFSEFLLGPGALVYFKTSKSHRRTFTA
jgi:hypothetical protein